MATRTLMPVVEPVGDAKALLGESVCYDGRTNVLHWIDIPGRTLFATDAASGRTTEYAFPQEPGFVHPCDGDTLLVGQADSILRFDGSKGESTRLAAVEAGDPTTRTNDAACDPRGRLVFGTMRPNPERMPDSAGSLYLAHADGRVTPLVSGLSIANGLAFGADGGTLYWADTPRRTIMRAVLDADAGCLHSASTFAELPESLGRPDGAAVDAGGCYWAAAVWGWQLLRFTPRGDLDLVVRLPVQRPTKLAFGGTDLRTIYVTSASQKLDAPEDQPLAGRLIALDVGIRGLPANPFRTA